MNKKTPLYFYHLVNKEVNLSKGIVSLQYMYNHKMDEEFDKNVLKYEKRIREDWNLKEFKEKENLTRKDYLDGLKEFRGVNGANYIYFFRFPPFKKLGAKIKALSEYKDIYRINIKDEALKKQIEEIFWGYHLSWSDNQELDETYYEQIDMTTYFKNYNDQLEMNFSTLNHIAIAFKKGYCPSSYLEKINWPETYEDIKKIEGVEE